MRAPDSTPGRAVSRWLFSLYLLVGVMVVVGGVTRLTGSGLSITEWAPIMGALPPMNDADWQVAFAKYQATPQFLQVHASMTLDGFKGIFFWEYLHRLLGRLLGVAFALPWVYFLARGRLRGRWARRTLVAFVLGGAQGALGWFMVKSGLVDVPRVSHLRLAAHLSLAFFVGQYLLWLWLDLRRERRGPSETASTFTPGPRAAWAFIVLLSVQIVWGAFMAGSRAGYLFNTFPDLNGAYTVGLRDFVNDPVGIHWLHRTLGYVVGVVGLALAWRWRRDALGGWLGALVLAQVLLGVWTVVASVPLALGAIHQLGAWALLSVAVVVAHGFHGSRAVAGPER